MAKTMRRRRLSWDQIKVPVNQPWYDLSKNWNQLVGIGRALQGKNSWPIRKKIGMDVAGATYLEKEYIEIDPSWFGKGSSPLTEAAQFDIIKSVIMHEAGHRRFTERDAWNTNSSALKHNLINLLEDYRIENGMKQMYPRRAEALELLVYRLTRTPDDPQPPESHYATTAYYIFQSRMGGWYLPFDINIYTIKIENWLLILPLIDEASHAPSTWRVVEIAEEILMLLGIDDDDEDTDQIEEKFPSCCEGTGSEDSTSSSGDMPSEIEDLFDADGELSVEVRDIDSLDKPMPTTFITQMEQIASEISPEHPTAWNDNKIMPTPYAELYRLAVPAMHDMRRAFSIPRKTLVKELSTSGGRVSVRDWIKDQTKPFKSMNEEVSKPTVALSVMIDCSTSMTHPFDYPTCQRVSSLAMAIYMAAMQTNTPCRFSTLPGIYDPSGTKSIVDGVGRTPRVICDNTTPQAIALPLLAGISKPWASSEDVPYLLPIEGEWLNKQDAEVKLIFVLHDGQSNDSHLIKEEIRKLRVKGIRVLGVGLAIRDALLREQFGDQNFVGMEDLTQIGKIIAKRIKNLRRL